MKITNTLITTFLAGTGLTATVPRPKIAKIPINRKKSNSTSLPNNYAGASDANSPGDFNFETDIAHSGIIYTVDTEIGNPGQKITLEVDTGSSDTYVVVAENEACSEPDSCKDIFDPSMSYTWNTNASDPFSIGYNDGRSANGNWGTDDLSIAGNTVTDLSIGLNIGGSMSNGILGIGLASDESTYSYNNAENAFMYENYPMKLKSEGFIDRVAYSIYLDSQDSDSGTLLFGGVDKSKYTGPLYTIPLAQEPSYGENYQELRVTVKSISMTDSDNELDLGIDAVLDSGTTYLWGPSELTDQIADWIGGERYEAAYSVDCSKLDDSSELEFDFGGFRIKNPVSDYVYKSGDMCMLKLVYSDKDEWMFGDVFLQHAYVVYDLEGKQVAMAQADYSNPNEDIEPITDSIPGATPAPSS